MLFYCNASFFSWDIFPLLVIFFIPFNFYKLFFTVQRGKVNSSGEGCAFIYLFSFLLLLRGRAWRLTFSSLLPCTARMRKKWPSRIRPAILALFSDPERKLCTSPGNRGSKTTSLFPCYGLLPPSIYLETCYTLSFFNRTTF